MMKLSPFWRKTGLTTKFSLAGGALLTLIIIIGVTGYFSLNLVIDADQSILISTDIQRRVYEMDRGLARARRMNDDFFIQYPRIGLSKAHEAFAQPSIRQIAQVIASSKALKEIIRNTKMDLLLDKSHVDLNLYLSTAQRFADTSIASYELVTELVAPGTGVDPRLDKQLTQLFQEIRGNDQLKNLFQEMRYFIQSYRISHQRYLMQSAFNEAFKLREEINSIPIHDKVNKEKAIALLDLCLKSSNRILEIDGKINNALNDFVLQAETVAPISATLVSLAKDQVEIARKRIKRSHTIATIIIFIISFSGLVTAIIISRIINKTITRKIISLTRSAGEFRKGNLNLSVEEDSEDELGELAKTFNLMAARIKEMVDHLEEKVELRTHELATINKELLKEIQERANAEKEKQQLELQLRQAHKMEAIGTLAGGIAHDFNNILAAILGYSEMAKDDTPEFSPARHYIEEVVKAGCRAKDLISQILTFSRKSQNERTPVIINRIVDEALKMLRASLPATIEIRKDLSAELAVLADPTQIHQILINLCSNAAHAMEDKGGIIRVSLTLVELTEKDMEGDPHLKPGRYAALSVSDTGTGITKDVLERIFDPYFTTKDVGKGSGMGLSVVHGIVKSNNGKIHVDSVMGKGSTFTVYLPSIEAEVDSEVHPSESIPTGHERILIVDDEEMISDITRQRLERLGYQAITSNNSKEALELFRSNKDGFDLVITDQTMPHMTGEHMARELMDIRPDIPIIITTGYSSQLNEKKAAQIGIKALLMKPVDKISLAKTVRKVLDEHKTKET